MPDIFITPEIEATLALPNTHIVVSFSGGKDSECTLHALHTRYGATHPIHVVFSDTGNEYTDDADGRWVSAMRWCIQRAAAYGYGLHIVKNSKRTLPEEVLERGRFPSPGQRWCTAHHKRGPIERFIRSLKADNILAVKGIRADESDARAEQSPWEPYVKLTVKRQKHRPAAHNVGLAAHPPLGHRRCTRLRRGIRTTAPPDLPIPGEIQLSVVLFLLAKSHRRPVRQQPPGLRRVP